MRPAHPDVRIVDDEQRELDPTRCVVCGEDAVGELDHEVTRLDRGDTALGLALLGGIGAGYTSHQTVQITIALCASHRPRAANALAMDAAAPLVGLAWAVIVIAVGIAWGVYDGAWFPFLAGSIGIALAGLGVLELTRRQVLLRAGVLFGLRERLGRLEVIRRRPTRG